MSLQNNRHFASLIKLAVSVLMAAIAFFLGRSLLPVMSFCLSLSYLAFSLTYLLLIWPIILTRKVAEIQKKANEDEGGRLLSLLLVCIAAFACLGSAVFLLSNHQDIPQKKVLIPILSVCSILLSWALVHTVFTLHYAHEFYDERKQGGIENPLNFHSKDLPDYLDFAYFSFGIGATFQVADVEIRDKKIRRLVFFHSLLSFLLNTFVVALTINIVAGILK